jgi:diguanylate cyclase (GGDEF)-like protein
VKKLREILNTLKLDDNTNQADELIIANKELHFQNDEKEKRAAELLIANDEKDKQADELLIANDEKDKQADELLIANEEKHKRAEEINNLAFYDSLTQLPNRCLLFDRLNQALATSARTGQRSALLFLGLDHFKTLNDTLGYDLGDLLLQQVAAELTAYVREDNTVAHIGGDEFVVLLEGLSLQAVEATAQTQDIAEKILLLLNHPYLLNTHRYHSTISIGAIVFRGHEETSEEFLKQADIAMHQAKGAGRNALRFFEQTMQEVITARADMEYELRKAIEHHQFQLYYQIQLDHTGQALGAEALIRWIHPERGMISPFHFISLAEETELILPIGQWVLETACAQLETWQQNPLTQHLVLAVNVSAKQFHQEDFVEQVKAILQRHDINPALLKLELTESMLVNNISDIIRKMNALSKIGIVFSLDDFGTGYSSLQYLKKLPLNQLKIDQSFVRDIVTDVDDRAIVRTIITMANSLGINVIAEGVETAEQRQFLLDSGCIHYQGYLFSKPVPIDEFEALLKKD